MNLYVVWGGAFGAPLLEIVLEYRYRAEMSVLSPAFQCQPIKNKLDL